MAEKDQTDAHDGLSEEVLDSLEALGTEIKRVNIMQDRESHKRFQPFYEKRRGLISKIPNFWPTVFKNHHFLDVALQHRDDVVAMSCLKDLLLIRDELEPRAFAAEFHFSENPYFSDTVLRKVYKYEPSPVEGSSKPLSTDRGEGGVSEAELAFDWNEDIKPQAFKIKWKSEAKNLCKLFPRLMQRDDQHDIVEPGSFFNYFENDDDPDEFGRTLDEDVYPKAVQYFLGRGENMAVDPDAESETDDEDDGGDDGSVDLEEERPKKKVKTS